jgi:hypothetical protein
MSFDVMDLVMPIAIPRRCNGQPVGRIVYGADSALHVQTDKVNAQAEITKPTNITHDKEDSRPNTRPTPSTAPNVALSSSDPANSADETARRRNGTLPVNLRSVLDAQGATTHDLGDIPGQTVRTPRLSRAGNGAGNRDVTRASSYHLTPSTGRSSHVLEDEHKETGWVHGMHPGGAYFQGTRAWQRHPCSWDGDALLWLRNVNRHGSHQHLRQPDGGRRSRGRWPIRPPHGLSWAPTGTPIGRPR